MRYGNGIKIRTSNPKPMLPHILRVAAIAPDPHPYVYYVEVDSWKWGFSLEDVSSEVYNALMRILEDEGITLC